MAGERASKRAREKTLADARATNECLLAARIRRREADPRRTRIDAMITFLAALRDSPEHVPNRTRAETTAENMYRVMRGAQLAGDTREADWRRIVNVVMIAATDPPILAIENDKEAMRRARWAINELRRVDPKFAALDIEKVWSLLRVYVPKRDRGGRTAASIAAELSVDAKACGERIYHGEKADDGDRDQAIERVRRKIEAALAKSR